MRKKDIEKIENEEIKQIFLQLKKLQTSQNKMKKLFKQHENNK